MSDKAKATVTARETKTLKSSPQRRQSEGASSCGSPACQQVIHLQRTIGNHAVQRLVQGSGIRGVGSGERIQAKLTIGPPNDVYEQEADRVADQVMRMPKDINISGQRSAISSKDEVVQMKPG